MPSYVLCKVVNSGKSEPFRIGVNYGKTKTLCANTFLEPTVSDINTVLNEGISMEGHRVSVKRAAVVCDAPTKAYVLGVKGHSGYLSCTTCTTEGDFLQGCICFPELDDPPKKN